jgi:putative hemolysin
MALEVLVILLLVIANGLFAMSEIAVISSRKTRLEDQARRGNRRAGLALELANSPTRFLSTVQIGITLIGILAGALGGATIARAISEQVGQVPALAPYSRAVGLGVVVVAITYLSLIIGELAPKRLALYNPERIAAAVSGPMHFLSRLATPLVRLLSASTDLVVRLFGVTGTREPAITEEEIKLLIEQGSREGVIEAGEQEMLQRVFHLADQRVSELMTPRPQIVWLDLTDPIMENRKKLIASKHARFPVCHNSLDEFLGIAHVNDLLADCLQGHEVDLTSKLQKPLLVAKNTKALRVLELFKQSGMHIALLIDEYGVIQGLVTLNDILEALVDYIPAVDEAAHQRAVQREDGSWLLDGRLSTTEFRELLPDVDYLPGEQQGNFRTLGGFVITYLGRIPTTAEFFHWRDLRFEVVDMDGNRIDKILVTREQVPSKRPKNEG